MLARHGVRYVLHDVKVLSLEKLIATKKAAGRPKDLLALLELEALLKARRS